ncbi:MAG TPA: hypothetical protein VKW77_04385, partial [Acidimicrobiales bacterium]|nr:hypothetical protein [Acidimicrobiales bacterium]
MPRPQLRSKSRPATGPVPTPTAGEASASATVMTPPMVLLFATACGVSAANLYYAQPLLPEIARS